MSSSNAWLLECGEVLTVAVSDHEIVECVHPERYHKVPGTPDYCSSVLAWQDKLVPVMDLAAALDGIPKTSMDTAFVCLLSYQLAPKQPLQYLALRINNTPQKILVDDEQVCEMPAEGFSALLKSVSLCAFSHQQLPVPILDIAKLCSDEFRELAQVNQDSLGHDLPAAELMQVNSG
jgi:chemotaxis signal transduction protein